MLNGLIFPGQWEMSYLSARDKTELLSLLENLEGKTSTALGP